MTNEKNLEILVVEDNPSYLDVAKSYFNSISSLKADYATTRDEAIAKLNSKTYDGVITDRGLPGFKEDKFQPNLYMQNNGWYVALHSNLKGIPIVIFSYHYTLCRYFLPLQDSSEKTAIKQHIKTIEEGFKISDREQYHKIFSLPKFCDMEDMFASIARAKGLQRLNYWCFEQEITKKDSKSWEYALNYLKLQIEYSERNKNNNP